MRKSLRAILVAGLAVGLLAWFLRNADLRGVWRAVVHGRMDLLFLALLTTLGTYVLRAVRWRYLLRGLGPTRFSNAFEATVVGFAANTLLPARAGEFLRPYLLARRESLSATSAFATIVLERAVDAASVLMFFSVFLFSGDPALTRADPTLLQAVKGGSLAVAAFTTAVLAFFFVMAGHPDKLARASLRVEAVLPARLARLLARVVRTFAEGLSAIRRPQQLVMVLLWSVPLWLSIAAGIWLVTRAFGIEQRFAGSFLTMTILVVGVAVPTPGSVGGFHEAYRIAATVFFQAPNDAAVGAAIVLHAISFVPVTILGVIFMAREGLTLGRMRRMAEGAGAGEAAR